MLFSLLASHKFAFAKQFLCRKVLCRCMERQRTHRLTIQMPLFSWITKRFLSWIRNSGVGLREEMSFRPPPGTSSQPANEHKEQRQKNLPAKLSSARDEENKSIREDPVVSSVFLLKGKEVVQYLEGGREQRETCKKVCSKVQGPPSQAVLAYGMKPKREGKAAVRRQGGWRVSKY